MAKRSPFPPDIAGLLAYVSQPAEKANEDLALAYFRKRYEGFTRQKEAGLCDGYVPGHFILELKGKSTDWLKGLLQGLCYRSQLDFGSIVVAAESFLAIWHLGSLPEDIIDAARQAPLAPSKAAPQLLKRFASRKQELLRAAAWRMEPERVLDNSLYHDPAIVAHAFSEFDATLRSGKRVRLNVTAKNFTAVLRGLVPFFAVPMKAVRAFYAMIFEWHPGTPVSLSAKHPARVTFGGESIDGLIPSKREAFKEYVEKYAVSSAPGELDEFFSRFDEALDTAVPEFRIQHGIFFTDQDLARFVMWLVKRHLGDIGKNYLVIDPACGSGNLVTNWRSPLELRHKVVSELEPDLLFAVERRMQADAWHDGRFTVVPKVEEDVGLNFLDKSAADYLDTLRKYLAEKGHNPNRPIAFLCNPPFRNDKDRQRADPITYEVDGAIVDLIGSEATQSRDCCFLAQMKLVCDAAAASELEGDSLLLVFTKLGWLTNRGVLRTVRDALLKDVEFVSGIIVNGAEFFDIGKFPVAFTVWRYKAGVDSASRSTPLLDLTTLEKAQLGAIDWTSESAVDTACDAIVNGAQRVALGVTRTRIYDWAGSTMLFFLRERRQAERPKPEGPFPVTGGLPVGDERRTHKKAYGEPDGAFIGFMDDKTPCRVKRGQDGVPWFRLDGPVMDCRKGRCFSGPPSQKGHVADTEGKAERLMLWYAIQTDFAQHGYPMWADADELWAPTVPPKMKDEVERLTRAILFASNECLEICFPANNPEPGLLELWAHNPLSPNADWWKKNGAERFSRGSARIADRLVEAVNALYVEWGYLFGRRPRLPMDVERRYYPGEQTISASSGLVQIKDYADLHQHGALQRRWDTVQSLLREARTEFRRILTSGEGLDYFGAPQGEQTARPQKRRGQLEATKTRPSPEKVGKKTAESARPPAEELSVPKRSAARGKR